MPRPLETAGLHRSWRLRLGYWWGSVHFFFFTWPSIKNQTLMRLLRWVLWWRWRCCPLSPCQCSCWKYNHGSFGQFVLVLSLSSGYLIQTRLQKIDFGGYSSNYQRIAHIRIMRIPHSTLSPHSSRIQRLVKSCRGLMHEPLPSQQHRCLVATRNKSLNHVDLLLAPPPAPPQQQ